MYRNLEEHREPKAADKMKPVQMSDTECHCQCKAPAEQGKEAKPAGNQTAAGLKLHYDLNG